MFVDWIDQDSVALSVKLTAGYFVYGSRFLFFITSDFFFRGRGTNKRKPCFFSRFSFDSLTNLFGLSWNNKNQKEKEKTPRCGYRETSKTISSTFWSTCENRSVSLNETIRQNFGFNEFFIRIHLRFDVRFSFDYSEWKLFGWKLIKNDYAIMIKREKEKKLRRKKEEKKRTKTCIDIAHRHKCSYVTACSVEFFSMYRSSLLCVYCTNLCWSENDAQPRERKTECHQNVSRTSLSNGHTTNDLERKSLSRIGKRAHSNSSNVDSTENRKCLDNISVIERKITLIRVKTN